ncbi:DUF4880 domain-containing protein [Asticcacaulis sp. YBE204]|uniref:FecR/PupR family sigma factor regulator n=1 Tax=Asticcacaulis sp. YBE204 TaxID=1282363 RepID=UPI0003C3E542|nr:DUF4880 domain-containing protein [Asticcacaulis sp. YBE204]ESQ76973.1 hypothetical protein AEYBE204_19040 [Asticcacaulis sp. YBE204]
MPVTNDNGIRIAAEASAWLVRLIRDEPAPATALALHGWLNISPNHKIAFERITQMWESLPQAAQSTRDKLHQ